ncbi:phosphonate ABC transporter ATP-binding protein [Natrialbaceae archaeon A-CW3]
MLQVSNLVKVYSSGDQALDGVSVTVGGQETVAVIGPSGAGKSTFLRCINRLVEPTDGSVQLDGTEITSLSKRELRHARRDMGMVFQEYGLVERLTVMENVLSGRLGYTSTWAAFRRLFSNSDIDAAYETLERVGLEGYENKRADELSGGQRQRVGIARAIIQRPKILLVDEPTSSLDPETSHAVMKLLVEAAEEESIPVLINIHDVKLAETYADRVVGITDGSVVFDGPPSDLDEQFLDEIYRSESANESSRRQSEPEDTVAGSYRS